MKNLGNKVRARALDYFGWLFGGATHAHLRKMCEYFADDKDGESLQQDWAKAEPSDKEAKQGWLAGWVVGDELAMDQYLLIQFLVG